MDGVGGAGFRSHGLGPAAMQENRFAKVDKNGDGQLDTEELQAAFDRMAEKMGFVPEGAPTPEEVVETLDTDGDGALTKEEMEGFRATFGPPPRPPGPRPGPPPGARRPGELGKRPDGLPNGPHIRPEHALLHYLQSAAKTAEDSNEIVEHL